MNPKFIFKLQKTKLTVSAILEGCNRTFELKHSLSEYKITTASILCMINKWVIISSFRKKCAGFVKRFRLFNPNI